MQLPFCNSPIFDLNQHFHGQSRALDHLFCSLFMQHVCRGSILRLLLYRDMSSLFSVSIDARSIYRFDHAGLLILRLATSFAVHC
jgi:hypothetical protein